MFTSKGKVHTAVLCHKEPTRASKAPYSLFVCEVDGLTYRNIRKKIKDLGLQAYFDGSEGELHDHVRLIWSLCLVPPESVLYYWENIVVTEKPELDLDPNGDPDEQERLRRDIDEKVDDLHTYVERNYVGYIRQGKRKDPRFAVADWNKHEMAKMCLSLTTNKAEVGLSCISLSGIFNDPFLGSEPLAQCFSDTQGQPVERAPPPQDLRV